MTALATLFWLLGGIVIGFLIGWTFLRRRGQRQVETIRRLTAAVDQSHSAVMITDLEGRITYANVGLCHQMGYMREEMLGRAWREFQQAETPPALLEEMVATVRAGRSWRNEWYNRRKNGELYLVRGCVTPVKDGAGKLSCFVTIFEDLTDFKRGEQELNEALERAKAGERAKDRFLATMSHEMRTPLNGISGFTTLLAETPLTPDQAECVQHIGVSSRILIRLTEDILELARIEGGQLKLEPGFCDPRQCVEDILDQLADPAAEKGVELLHWVEDDVPASIVVDEGRLRQVLASLVGNAVKFTEAGEVEVCVRTEPAPDFSAGGQWRLTFAVRDTGIGIAAPNLDKLFTPFSQVDESSTRRYGGIGLGLAIAKKLVELMGGRIAVESADGLGSTFRFTVPVAIEPLPPRPAPDLAHRRVALAARPGPFRREFARLAGRWRVGLVEVDRPADLAGAAWDLAFVEVDENLARSLAGQTPVLREKAYAVVSATLPAELRAALRAHFILLLNKPLHHDALLYLLKQPT
jgi:PAS domain S-box-containing protein